MREIKVEVVKVERPSIIAVRGETEWYPAFEMPDPEKAWNWDRWYQAHAIDPEDGDNVDDVDAKFKEATEVVLLVPAGEFAAKVKPREVRIWKNGIPEIISESHRAAEIEARLSERELKAVRGY